MQSLRSKITRARKLGADHGARAVVVKVRAKVLARIYLNEDHVWYVLDLTGPRRRLELPADVRLARATADDLHLAAQMDQSPVSAARHHAAGNDLWLALRDQEPLFSCWIFHRVAPLLAGSHGRLELPEHMALLEDSYSPPTARGQGVGHAAMSQITETLADSGVTKLITKIETTNGPSRRAVQKAGFEEAAVMRTSRLVTRKEVRVTPIGAAADVGREIEHQVVG